MRIALVSYFDAARNHQYPAKHSLGAMRLAAYLADKRPGWTVRVRSFAQDVPPDRIAGQLDAEAFDVVGLPGYIWTRELSRSVARCLLTGDRQPLVVLGGPETRSMTLDGWPAGTAFVAGQGEEPLLWLCDAREASPQADVAALVADPPVPVFATRAQRPRVLPLAEPRREDKQLPQGLPLFGPEFAPLCDGDEVDDRFVWFETARGCIYSCSFCGHNTLPFFATFDDEFVTAEIRNLVECGVDSTFVIDPILGGRPSRGKRILRAFQAHAPSIDLRAYMRPEFLDDEFIEILAESNITELLMGLQTTNPAVPSHVRGNNFKKIMRYVPDLADRGVTWRAELIVGLPGDTLDGLRESFRFVIDDLRPRSVYAYHLTAIPETLIHDMIDRHDRDFWITTDGRLRVTSSNSFDAAVMLEMATFAGGVMSRHSYLQETGSAPSFAAIEDDVAEVLATQREVAGPIFARLDMDAGVSFWHSWVRERTKRSDSERGAALLALDDLGDARSSVGGFGPRTADAPGSRLTTTRNRLARKVSPQ